MIFILLYKSGSLYFFSLNIAFLVLNSFVYKNSLVLPDSFEICVVNRKNVTLLHCFYVCYNYNILKRFYNCFCHKKMKVINYVYLLLVGFIYITRSGQVQRVYSKREIYLKFGDIFYKYRLHHQIANSFSNSGTRLCVCVCVRVPSLMQQC